MNAFYLTAKEEDSVLATHRETLHVGWKFSPSL
jgi:hypothetical protein